MYVSMVGTTYAFSIYSTLLVSNLSFTDDDLYWIASIGNTGLYLSVVSGMMLEAYGIRVVITLGAVLIFAGTFYIFF